MKWAGGGEVGRRASLISLPYCFAQVFLRVGQTYKEKRATVTLTRIVSPLCFCFGPLFRPVDRQSLPAIEMAVFPPVIGDGAGNRPLSPPPLSGPMNLGNNSDGVAAATGRLLRQEGQQQQRRQGQQQREGHGGVDVEAGRDTLSSSPGLLRPVVVSPFSFSSSSSSSPNATATTTSPPSSLSPSTSSPSPSRSTSPLPPSSLPALRHINLGRCDGVTDRALARVAGAFPGLEGVRLEHCLRVTDVGVAALAAGCPGLRALGLRNCGQVRCTCCMHACWGLVWCACVRVCGFACRCCVCVNFISELLTVFWGLAGGGGVVFCPR